MQITKDLMTKVRADIDAALKDVAKQHGIGIRVGSGSYERDGSAGHFKLELAGVTADGLTKEQSDFKTLAPLYGMREDWLGKKISLRSKPGEWTIAGLMPARTKFPVLITCGETRLLVPPESVIGAMALGGKKGPTAFLSKLPTPGR